MKLKFAVPDIHRHHRQNFPEAIYCPGKTIPQIISIAKQLYKTNNSVIMTRADKKVHIALKKSFATAKYNELGRLVTVKKINKPPKPGYIAVLTAGTADIPVAEEASGTLEFLDNKVERIYDVGVAGIHRLFEHQDKINNAKCVIVCAGMEGALPSIVGGLAKSPVIGVPTSVGYGTNFAGLTALFTMLNSCAANVCVVNIDDGFGAAIVAHLINRDKPL
jgi:hypothetical protein